jgi:methionine biosynthesis protein MetW
MKLSKYYDNYQGSKSRGILSLMYNTTKRFEKNRFRSIRELLPTYSEILLDYGCKEGKILAQCKDKYKKGVGVDISKKMLEKAKENNKSNNVKFIQGNAEEKKLPIEDRSIDTIICTDVIEHVFDPEKLLREFSRILKEKGTLIITTPNIAWLPHRITLLFGRRPRTSWAKGWDGGHISYFTFREMGELLRRLNFRIIKRTTGGSFWFLRTWWPSLLGANIVIKAKKR